MASKKKLKELAMRSPSFTEVTARFLELQVRDDAVVAIHGMALVEHALELALLAQFRDLSKSETKALFDGMGSAPLASFYAKALIGRAVGLIGPVTLRDLDNIRAVRNAFAHSRALLTFDNPDALAICREFEFIRTRYTPETLGEATARNLFLWETGHLASELYNTWHNPMPRGLRAQPDSWKPAQLP